MPRVVIRPGSIRDLDELADWHYRAHRPASIVRVLTARLLEPRHEGAMLGVLAVSMPVLNGRWRALAWPGRYSTGDRRADARRLNRELRTISRVIVDPRARGLGIATILVRAYLAHPLTPATEAISAMGSHTAFFERAGMTSYRLEPTPSQQRFLDFLDAIGTTPARVIQDLSACRRLAQRRDVRREIQELSRRRARRWIDASLCGTDQLRAACASVSGEMTAFAHVRGSHARQDG
ncbi:MAG: hypothetical protein AB7G11_05010 [Phycisphaerales bacterium]